MDMQIQTDNTKGTWKALAWGILMAIWWVLTTVAGGALWLLNKVTGALDSHNTMSSLVDAAGEVIKHLPDSNIDEDDNNGFATDTSYDDDQKITHHPYRTHIGDSSVPPFINEKYR